jgi:hypothetical protein
MSANTRSTLKQDAVTLQQGAATLQQGAVAFGDAV